VPVPVSFTIPSPGLNYLVYYIGQAKGLYAAEGVDIEIQVLPANTGLAALLSGQSDATGAAGSAARAAATGSPLRVIMGLIDQSDLSLHAGPEIATLQDLRGKNVAITSVAGTPAQVARRIVQGAGLNPDSDVAFVQTQTPPQTYAALLAGGVPAAMLSPPLAGQAERAGYRVLAYGKDFIRSTQAGIAATEERIAGQPDKLARLIRGTLRAIAFTLDREDETAEFVASQWELSAEDARATYRTLAEGIVRDGLTDLAIIEGELQLAGENVTGEQVVDYSLLRRVLAEPAWRDVCAERAGRRPKGCR
jgi:ABC-type nitrate/sulfonate/bicarbonate transport system substrate-binding protein